MRSDLIYFRFIEYLKWFENKLNNFAVVFHSYLFAKALTKRSNIVGKTFEILLYKKFFIVWSRIKHYADKHYLF